MKCKYWKDHPDGFNGYCQHPDATGEACTVDTEDTCPLMEDE